MKSYSNLQAAIVTEIVTLSSAVAKRMVSSAFLHVEFVKALHARTPLMMPLTQQKIQMLIFDRNCLQ